MDVRDGNNQRDGHEPDECGKAPTAIGFRRNVSIDVVCHAREYSPSGTGTETSEFGKNSRIREPFVPNPLSQVLSGPYLDAPAA
jgi:hypothetical protein